MYTFRALYFDAVLIEANLTRFFLVILLVQVQS